jgi:DNA ligase (NAD+)
MENIRKKEVGRRDKSLLTPSLRSGKARIEKLKKVINYHRHLYHVLDKQEISEEALDSLKHQLYKLEQEYPEFITFDSPTQRIGGKALEKFKKVKHNAPMLSLEDVVSEKELEAWENYLKRLIAKKQEKIFSYFTEMKIDGFAVSLLYENGIFIRGATRGNGKIGEDVTQNLKTIESIPLKLQPEFNNLSQKLEVRGEVYMEKDDFEKLNEKLKKQGKAVYSNPRNLAAGSIRQLDPSLAAARPLKFLAYDLIDSGLERHSQKHELLKKIGFKVDPGRICKNIFEIISYWKEIAKKRGKLPYQIDGIVISVNNNFLFEKLGIAGKSPRAARAFKFSPKQAVTKILDIKIQVGRTGAITPVAFLEPAQIEGVSITRATLHNEGEIRRLGVKIGDAVIIERAGDVIPHVSKVLSELRIGKEKDFHFPKICPICSSELKKPGKEAVWRCLDNKCPARKIKNIYHFSSQKVFNIEGLGPKIINKLIDAGIISKAADLFSLKEGDVIFLEGFAEKSAKNLIESIQKSKKINLERFILALGIRHVGEETAFDLASYFGSINNLQKASKEDLEKISDIGPETAKSIHNWFALKHNQKFIEELFLSGVEIIKAKTGPLNNKLKGIGFVFSGTLDSITRDEAEKRVRLMGGGVSGTVSKMTDYLVVGESPGSKLEKAKSLGVKIIKEEDFLKMIS